MADTKAGQAARKAFVCGHPIAHSRSPLIHGYWLQTHGVDGSYERIDVAPEDFPVFLNGFADRGYAGGNVTIPNKELAFAQVARRDAAAEAIGAVNTLWVEGGQVVGGNTDALGFAANLDDQIPGWDEVPKATVLGAGGAARAVVHALKTRGVREIRIVNRTVERARELLEMAGGTGTASAHPTSALNELLPDTGLLINTTSLGMKGEGAPPADTALLPDSAIVSDIVYVPLMTPLLAAAKDRNLRISDGLGMLLHQAVPGFERWFGVRPRVTPDLRALIVADIEAAK